MKPDEDGRISRRMTFGGVSCDEGGSVSELLTLADAKLYQGKKEGRNRLCL